MNKLRGGPGARLFCWQYLLEDRLHTRQAALRGCLFYCREDDSLLFERYDICYYRYSVTSDTPYVYRVIEVVDNKHIRVQGINTKFMNGIRPVEAFVTQRQAQEMRVKQRIWEARARAEYGLYEQDEPQTVEEAVI